MDRPPLLLCEFLCAGGVFYALFISLMISKLFCTKGYTYMCGRGWEGEPPSRTKGIHFVAVGVGGRLPLEGMGLKNHIKLITYSTKYRKQNTEYSFSKFMNIKFPMYLFTNIPICYMALGLIDFDGGNSFARCPGPKLNFQGPPPLPMALEMDLPAPYKQQIH